MVQLEFLLLELVGEDFTCSWTQFEFVLTTKQWNENKQLAVISTLLRGKLID